MRSPASAFSPRERTARPAGTPAAGRPGRGWRRGELATLTGVHPETIRYYESIGLLPAPARRANGYREYDARHRDRLRFIARARALGFPLEEIRSLLELADGGVADCATVQRITAAHLAAIRARIRDLERIAAVLQHHLARCGDATAVPACPFLEALFAQDPAPARKESRA